MMRKIEREMIEAIQAKKYYIKHNTEVCCTERGDCQIYLYGHLIADIVTTHAKRKVLYLYDCGCPTKTTKSRLNAILNHFNLPTIYAKNFQWYIGTEVWNGSTSYLILGKKEEENVLMS